MKTYKFKTLTTSYYFPELNAETRFVYSLYGNYGGFPARTMWWLFCHCGLVRWLNRVELSEIEGVELVQKMLGDVKFFGVNMGTSGPEQKKSILGLDLDNSPFFAKIAVKERAKILSRNEIKVYKLLADTGLVPHLCDSKETAEYVYLRCEYIKGEHVHNADRKQLMDILKQLRMFHYDNPKEAYRLETCFAHHDFCPWNMIDVSGKLHIIDWEMAEELPLGYDLFTFLLQTEFLTGTGMDGKKVIEQNRDWINEYFEDLDWIPYLKAFIANKVAFYSIGQNNTLLDKYKKMSSDFD